MRISNKKNNNSKEILLFYLRYLKGPKQKHSNTQQLPQQPTTPSSNHLPSFLKQQRCRRTKQTSTRTSKVRKESLPSCTSSKTRKGRRSTAAAQSTPAKSTISSPTPSSRPPQPPAASPSPGSKTCTSRNNSAASTSTSPRPDRPQAWAEASNRGLRTLLSTGRRKGLFNRLLRKLMAKITLQ